jgi:REP element-mobilizing transposase RayT
MSRVQTSLLSALYIGTITLDMNVEPLSWRKKMLPEATFYRRNLPHIHPKDGIFFITYRLAGSLPAHIVRRLRKEKEAEIKQLEKKFSKKEFVIEKYKLEKRFFGKYDDLLDQATNGPHWLKDQRIAQIVADKIHDLDGKRYRLIAYCLMSNHGHQLIDTTGHRTSSETNVAGKTKDYPLTDTMRLLLGNTARFCNLALGRGGSFWHNESYDHYVRDDQELIRIIRYILNNPVKAGLVKDWREWKFSFVAEEFST